MTQEAPLASLTLDEDDPGDETARRFRYQWTWAAIACCQLLDPLELCDEIFCEHHEDILVKLSDGRFRGVQVKTRDSTQDAWRIGDEGVDKSLARFCHLEQQFPGQFESFRFLTNHSLFSGANGKDLQFVLKQCRDCSDFANLPATAARLARKLASETGCPDSAILAALRKTTADDSLPKLADVNTRLVSTLTERWARAHDLSYAALIRAADHLVSECFRASSLAHEGLLPAYLPASSKPAEVGVLARIAGKRIDLARLQAVLESGLDVTLTLATDPSKLLEPGGGDRALLHRKLEAGGFSVVSQNSAADLRDKADYLGLVWTKKFGREDGLQRHAHIRSLVLSDAASAFEAVKAASDPFGVAMLGNLRSRLSQRRTGGAQVYGCSVEHLEGIAYSLTSECQIQWSVNRPWEVS